MSDWTLAAATVAASKGLVVCHPADNVLFVDIDDEASLHVFEAGLLILEELVGSHTLAPSPSNAPGHFHARVILKAPVRDKYERIALQAILGSDRVHEALSWRAATRGCAEPTLFFELPAGDATLATAQMKTASFTEQYTSPDTGDIG